MVTDLPVAPGMRSAAAIARLTPVTCPNITPSTNTWKGLGAGVGGAVGGTNVAAWKVPAGVETSIPKTKFGIAVIGN